ncbi:Arc family DNA-binding protein [Thiothrix sp.]|jgi:RNAse (barnase) inhibitor barstar|uniref:Arc family DNA-binding protein n=1 Tax=Thiothrix sp. TaxID=1032 RepID=UPI00338FACF5
MKSIQTQVRLPVELHNWVKNQAKKDNRSMNGELVHFLEKAREEGGVKEREVSKEAA